MAVAFYGTAGCVLLSLYLSLFRREMFLGQPRDMTYQVSFNVVTSIYEQVVCGDRQFLNGDYAEAISIYERARSELQSLQGEFPKDAQISRCWTRCAM